MELPRPPLKFDRVFYRSLISFFGLGIVLGFIALQLAMRIHTASFALQKTQETRPYFQAGPKILRGEIK